MDTTSLPTGTVTFLLTDVEGSTHLWEQHPEAMRVALARHDAILGHVIEQHGGVVIRSRGEGDSFFAVFARATEAVAAACALQRALLAEPWPAPLSLRVRVGINTGEAQLRQGDYYGPAINRCARLRAAGHGGQTLLGQVTSELVRDMLPAGAAPTPLRGRPPPHEVGWGLRWLGAHRLKDLERPEQIYQLLHSDLPADFPPLHSLDLLPNNLPVQLTSFIGRESEMAEVKVWLAKTRLLTLTGAGGCGKTRLALQVAADLLEEYPDGLWLVDLAPLADPARVPQAVAAVLGVREEPSRALLETLAESLQPRRLLVVLDNCEHLVEACATLCHALLRACPRLCILATSRAALNVSGETVWRVPSLSLPEPRPALPAESLMQSEAVRLFIDRAMCGQPRFTVTHANALAVLQVCRRLDGIPLAIELAAARVRLLSVEQIMTRLDDCFRLLSGGNRDALPRQQTLRATIDWSYDLLSEAERSLLRRVSVFAGGWTLTAAETVCAGDEIDEYEILDLLTRLVDKSLVVAEEQAGEMRYRLLETIRQYAVEHLRRSGEEATLRDRHRDWYLDLAEKAEPELTGSAQGEWLDRLETEHDNLRTALTAAIERGETDLGLRLGATLARFWAARGHLTEGREQLRGLLALAAGKTRTMGLARVLNGAGTLAHYQGDFVAARGYLQESLTIGRALNDKEGIADSLHGLGLVARFQGDDVAARTLHEESLTLYREIDNRRGIAAALYNLGNLARVQGDYAAARALHEESLLLYQEVGHKRGIALSLSSLGHLAHSLGDDESARSLYEKSLSIHQEMHDKEGIAFSLMHLGDIAQGRGDGAAARSLYEQSLTHGRELGDRWGIAMSLARLGRLALYQGENAMARALLEESLAIGRALGDRRGIAVALYHLGRVAKNQGDYAQAHSLLAESLVARWDMRSWLGIMECLAELVGHLS